MDPCVNRPVARYFRLAVAAGAVACVVLIVWIIHRQATSIKSREADAGSPTGTVAARNIDPRVHYVGDAACQDCHPRIAATYHKHPMGRSLRLVSQMGPPDRAEDNRPSFEANGLHFQVERRDGRMLHEILCRAPQGGVEARSESEVRYAIGAGKRGYSYLIERHGFLFQSPISWYAMRHAWGLSPHLSNALGPLERPVSALCLFCHANEAQPIRGTDNHYRQPLFDGMAIGCERCHGPGELHVRQAQAGTLAANDDTMVNPVRLPPALREAVCQQCHLQGVARVLRRGRQPFDFRPGLPLSDFWAVFVRPMGQTGASKFSSHVEQMNSSRCFQASAGQLGCISCHDPHELPSDEQKTSYFRKRCLACHREASCGLSRAQRRATRPDDSCIACHMPRRDSSNIAHMVSTDHRIRRRLAVDQPSSRPMDQRPADGINLVLFQEGTQGRADADVGRDRGVALMDLAGLPQPERARRRLAEAARRWLVPAVRETPDDVPAQQALGYALWLLGRQEGAWAAFQAALAREPEREETLVYAAGLRAQMQYPDEALELWQRVRRVNPWSVRAPIEMARLYVERRDWTQARAACETALRLDPFRDAARQLAIVCAWRSGRWDEARAEFEKLLRIRPEKEKALRAWFEREQRAGP